MPYLLNIAYLCLLLVASPWLLYSGWRKGKYRQGFAAKFLGLVPRRTGERPCVWFHAVSVGEVNLLAPLLKQLAAVRPDVECVISTTTLTGHTLASKKYTGHTVFYCPLDFTWAVSAALRRIRPSLLVLAELELWPNLIRAAQRHGAAVAIVNGRLSERSFAGYRRLRWLVGHVLRRVDCIAVQDATYAGRFLQLGAAASAVRVTGSVKFDGAQTDRGNEATRRLAALARIEPEGAVLLAGSTQEPEEAVVLETFRALAANHPRLRLVIVPRHPERFDAVAQLLERSGLGWARRSRLSSAGASPSQVSSPAQRNAPRILLVDAVGELGAWWGLATVGFVGGSLGSRGGQNMIEPAAYGVAVSFGPNTANFRDVVTALLARDAAVVVRDQDELTQFVERCLSDAEYREGLGARARQLVIEQRGATVRTIELLDRLLPGATAVQRRAA